MSDSGFHANLRRLLNRADKYISILQDSNSTHKQRAAAKKVLEGEILPDLEYRISIIDKKIDERGDK